MGETIGERREKYEVRDSMETRKKSERIIREMRRGRNERELGRNRSFLKGFLTHCGSSSRVRQRVLGE